MNTTKIRAIAAALLLTTASIGAHAASFFQVEAGIGAAHSADVGDGVWYQEGVSHSERQNSPAYMLGLTGPLHESGNWSARWHADYIYIGSVSASCECVPDANYDPVAHRVVNAQDVPRMSPFNGQGHVQGVPVTLDVGYSYNGWRLAAEAGAWVYWQTWHETVFNLANEMQDISHRTVPQLGYVVGARVERGNFALSYRYYNVSQKWNPYPGLVTGSHVLMASYRF